MRQTRYHFQSIRTVLRTSGLLNLDARPCVYVLFLLPPRILPRFGQRLEMDSARAPCFFRCRAQTESRSSQRVVGCRHDSFSRINVNCSISGSNFGFSKVPV
jgi:hypothetical protein